MCGKFTQLMPWREVHRLYAIHDEAGNRGRPPGEGGGDGGEAEERIETATPMRSARIMVLDDLGRRRLVRMRWGFDKPGKVEPGRYRPLVVHARCETIDQLPTFRKAFLEGRRGVLLVATFNEGEEVPSSKPGGKPRTRQYVLTPNDGQPIPIAVIWNRFTAESGAPYLAFVMVTTANNALIGTITPRMPAVLEQADIGSWLGETVPGEEPPTAERLKAMLKPMDGDWTMKPETPDPPPKPPRPPGEPKASAARKTTKPRQGGLFDL